jgi:hypothetical protein
MEKRPIECHFLTILDRCSCNFKGDLKLGKHKSKEFLRDVPFEIRQFFCGFESLRPQFPRFFLCYTLTIVINNVVGEGGVHRHQTYIF